MLKVTMLSCVRFGTFENASVMNDEHFNEVTTGDAVWTLVGPQILIDELEGRDDSVYAALIAELKTMPPNVCVALDG